MLTPRTAWGLDIGEATVKAVKMRRTAVGAEILAFDSIERTPPSEESGDKDYHLREAVTTLAQRNKFGKTPVVVSIPEPAFSRFIPLPPVDKKRIPEVVRYEARQQIPFPIEEVVWDYQPVREATEFGEETEVAIFSLRSQFVYALLANLSLCRVQPAAVLPVPLALYNFLTFDRDVAKGTIAVDMGAGSTDILICDPENFRVRNITVSGNGITRALAERLKIDRREAEALKRDCTDAVQAERLFKLIQPQLNDLVGQVQRTIGFFKSQIHNVRIEQALLLGKSFDLPGVSNYFVKQLDCDLLPSNVLERVTLANSVDGAALKQALPSLSVAIGLALEGVGQGRVQVNLMPRELLVRQEVAKKKPYVATAVACLAVMLGTNLMSLRTEKARIEEEIRTLADVTAQVDELDRVRTDYKKAETGVANAITALQKPTELSKGGAGHRGSLKAANALNGVLRPMDTNLLLTRVKYSPTKASFTAAERGLTEDGAEDRPAVRIELAGVALPGVTKAVEIFRLTPEAVAAGVRSEFDFVKYQVQTRLMKARTGGRGSERPVFANISFNQTETTFAVTCDFLVDG
jgi:type IV pilus assembly protein PilM